MDRFTLLRRAAMYAALVCATLGAAACGLDRNEMPALSGPSTSGVSVVLTATPDRLPRDGSSQSVVVVEVRDANGRGINGQRVTLSSPSGAVLSQTEVITGADGKASFAVVAPSQTTVISTNSLIVQATPVGTNADNSQTQIVSIALTGTTNRTSPSPSFTVNPQIPEINKVATFDATPTMDEGVQCRDACSYEWNFDDGVTAGGRIVTHAFTVARAYQVALTVTDASGIVVTARQTVVPLAPASPTVSIQVDPNPPLLNQEAIFTALATAAPNHSIVQYEWNFGDGQTLISSGRTVTKTYTSAATVAVTVKVTDDAGQIGGASRTLTIGTGLVAAFTISPTNPKPADVVNFNAGASTASNGATITEYRWDWGDGTTETTANSTAQHVFNATRTYVIRLTVVDSQGRTATITQNLAVQQ